MTVNDGGNTLRFKQQKGPFRVTSKVLGKIDLSSVKGGILKGDITNQAMMPLFDLINTTSNNGNEVLDKAEIKAFLDVLIKQAKKDKELANGDVDDVVKYLIKNAPDYGIDLKKLKIQDLYAFVEQLLNASANIETSEIETVEGSNVVKTTYKTGVIETINEDGTGKIEYTDENGNCVVQEMSAQRNLTHQVTKNNQGVVVFEGFYEQTTEGQTVPTKTVYTEPDKKTVTTEYTNGIEAKTTSVEILEGGVVRKQVTNYDDKGIQSTISVEDKKGDEVVKTIQVECYSNGKPKKTTMVQLEGENAPKTTVIEHNEEGIAVTTTVTETVGDNGVKTSVFKHDQKGDPESVIVTDEKGVISEYVYSGNTPVITKKTEPLKTQTNGVQDTRVTEYGYQSTNENEFQQIRKITEPGKTVIEVWHNGETLLNSTEVKGNVTTQTVYDNEKGIYTQTVTDSKKPDNSTVTVYNLKTKKPTEQIKTVGNARYYAKYDKNGNTEFVGTVNAQGEIQGNRFVVQFLETPKQFATRMGVSYSELQKANPGKQIVAGAELVIPGAVDPDVALRKTKNQEPASVVKQRVKTNNMLKQKCRLADNKGYGTKVGQYTIQGNRAGGRGFKVALDKKGQVVVLNSKNKVVSNDRVGYLDWWDSQKKITNADGETVVAVSRQDGHGRYYYFTQNAKIENGSPVPDGVMSGNWGEDNKYIPLADWYINVSDNFDYAIKNNPNCIIAGTADANIKYFKDPSTGETYLFDMSDGGRMVIGDAKIAAINADGKAIATNIRNAAEIASGTDEEALANAVKAIPDEQVFQATNKNLRDMGLGKKPSEITFWPTNTTPLENVLYGELPKDMVLKTLTPILPRLDVESAGSIIANAYKVNIPSCSTYDGVAMYGTPDTEVMTNITAAIHTPEVRKVVESQLSNLDNISSKTTNSGVNFVDLLANKFNMSTLNAYAVAAKLVENKVYTPAEIQYDSNGEAISTIVNEQSQRNLIITNGLNEVFSNVKPNEYGGVSLDGDKKRAYNAILSAVDPGSDYNNGITTADYNVLENACKRTNNKLGLRSLLKDNNDVQILIAATSMDDSTVNPRKYFNTNCLLFNTGEMGNDARANCTVYEIKNGDFSGAFKFASNDYYAELNKHLKNGDVKGINNFNDLYKAAVTAINKIEDEDERNTALHTMNMYAIASCQVDFEDKQMVDMIAEASRYADGCITADRASDVTKIWEAWDCAVAMVDYLKEDISEAGLGADRIRPFHQRHNLTPYERLLINKSVITGESVFYDENGNKITDAEQIEAIKQRNKEQYDEMYRQFASARADFVKAFDEEGNITDFGRWLMEHNIDGRQSFNTPEDMLNFYKNLENNLYRASLASQGVLYNEYGNNVSLNDVYKDMKYDLEHMSIYNAEFEQDGKMIKTGVIMVPVVLGSIATGGAAGYLGASYSLTTLSVGSTTFGATYGLNLVEQLTSNAGMTNEEHLHIILEASVNAGMVITGMAATRAAHIIKVANPGLELGTKFSMVCAADIGAGAAGEYLLTGTVTQEGVTYCALFSLGGNLIGLKALTTADDAIKGGAGMLDDASKQTSGNKITSALRGVLDENGNYTSGGKLGEPKRLAIEQELDALLNKRTITDVEALFWRDKLGQIASTKGNGDWARSLIHKLEDATGTMVIGEKHINILTATSEELDEIAKRIKPWSENSSRKQHWQALINRRRDAILRNIDEVQAMRSGEAPLPIKPDGNVPEVEPAIRLVTDEPVSTPHINATSQRMFDEAFNNSQLKRTTSQNAIGGRIGGSKFQELKAEFENLSALAKTPEQLQMLENLAAKFNPEHKAAFLEIINARKARLAIENPNELYLNDHHIVLDRTPDNGNVIDFNGSRVVVEQPVVKPQGDAEPIVKPNEPEAHPVDADGANGARDVDGAGSRPANNADAPNAGSRPVDGDNGAGVNPVRNANGADDAADAVRNADNGADDAANAVRNADNGADDAANAGRNADNGVDDVARVTDDALETDVAAAKNDVSAIDAEISRTPQLKEIWSSCKNKVNRILDYTGQTVDDIRVVFNLAMRELDLMISSATDSLKTKLQSIRATVKAKFDALSKSVEPKTPVQKPQTPVQKPQTLEAALLSKKQINCKMTIDGKEVPVTIYKNSQEGSNFGYWVKNNESGELMYVKYPNAANALPEDADLLRLLERRGMKPTEFSNILFGKGAQAKSEALAAGLYRAAGLEAPEVKIVIDADGNIGCSSKFLPDLDSPTVANYSAVREGFAVDCWLANWDACKTGNIMISNGKAIRLDVGGSLSFRARGCFKGDDFGENVNELISFFSQKSLSKDYLKGMTHDELMSSLRRVTSIDDATIKNLVQQSGCKNSLYLEEVLIARRNQLRQFEALCKKTPMKSGETIGNYINRIYNQTPKTKYSIDFSSKPASVRNLGDFPANAGYVMEKANTIYTAADFLTPSQKKMLCESYEAFLLSGKKRISHNASAVIGENNMLHSTNPEFLESILNKGLMSGEFSMKAGSALRDGSKPGSRTPMSVDVWDVNGSYSIGQYFSRNNVPGGEANFLPLNGNYPESVVLVYNKDVVDPTLMNNSYMVAKRNSVLYANNYAGGYASYTTHRGVPVGLPSNAIEKVIVPYNSSHTNSIINTVKNSGLDIKVYDTNGKLLYQP